MSEEEGGEGRLLLSVAVVGSLQRCWWRTTQKKQRGRQQSGFVVPRGAAAVGG